MNLEELLGTLESPIVIRPTRRMTQGELESYLDKAADILSGNPDHSEFRGYVFALLFYKRISDCFDEEVRTQVATLTKAGVPQDQALLLARDPQNHHFIVPEAATWATVARTAKAQLGQALNDAMLAIERANAHRQNNFDGILTGKIDFNKQDELPRDKLVNLINHFGSQTFDRAHVSDDLFGNAYEYAIQISPKSRSLRLKLSARDGMVVVAPPNLDRQKLLSIVAAKADWIGERMAGFDALRHLITTEPAARPQAFDLPALAESWRVEYKPMRSRTVTERTEHLDAIKTELDGLLPVPFVLHGRMSKKQRSALVADLDALPPDAPRVLLSTGKLVGEGFDHPPLDTLVLSMPVSWKGTLQQYAGRLHREHACKADVRIIDFVDTGHPALLRMWDKRKKGYRAMGYRVRVDDSDLSG